MTEDFAIEMHHASLQTHNRQVCGNALDQSPAGIRNDHWNAPQTSVNQQGDIANLDCPCTLHTDTIQIEVRMFALSWTDTAIPLSWHRSSCSGLKPCLVTPGCPTKPRCYLQCVEQKHPPFGLFARAYGARDLPISISASSTLLSSR